MAHDGILSKSATAAAMSILAAGAVVFAAGAPAAHADPKAPEIPQEYRSGLVEAGKVCKEVDAPLVAAVEAKGSGFKADAVSPAGMVSAGQLPPQVWGQYARDGEKPADPTASSVVTARYLCAVASEVDKAASIATPDAKTMMVLAVLNAGPAILPQLVYGSEASASPHAGPDGAVPSAAAPSASDAALKTSAEFATSVLKLRDEYRTQGI